MWLPLVYIIIYSYAMSKVAKVVSDNGLLLFRQLNRALNVIGAGLLVGIAFDNLLRLFVSSRTGICRSSIF